jgi:phosphoribosylamine--glycine ligase
MRVLVIGSGGREHALVWKLAQSKNVSQLYCAPGNPGIARHAECVLLKASDLHGLLDFARTHAIDLTVVGPEQPLADGIVDLFECAGFRIFGPSRLAAELEWSKAFAKEFMQRHGIPTADHAVFTQERRDDAASYVHSHRHPVVLKADGLAAGKGVVVSQSPAESLATLDALLANGVLGSAGKTVVIEEFMEGEEASVFAVCDGERFVILPPAQDHKRALDGDRGKNTGGMGAYAPAPLVSENILNKVCETIITPTLNGMMDEGRPYKGCLYVGLMLTPAGPKVVEYNCRFGDPETQVVLPLYNGDLLELLNGAAAGSVKADGNPEKGEHKSAVCVVVASGGYPDEYVTGREILGLELLDDDPGILVFHAGTKRQGDSLVTAGGRVLGITALSKEGLGRAIECAYEAVGKISFAGMHFRRDIGRKALVH